jgi:hypothetical protein
MSRVHHGNLPPPLEEADMIDQNARSLGRPPMNWMILPLLISFSIAAPYQAARGEVIDLHRTPMCDKASESCGIALKISGQIDVSSFNKFKRLVDQTRRQAESNKWYLSPPFVELDSPGGSVSAAMAIGRVLRAEQGVAGIKPEAVCYSSCVLVLAGAVGRIMEGPVGIHRPYFEVPKDDVSPDKITELFQKMLQDIRAYFREMNVSEQLADAMLRINPENMRVLNDAALNSYGLTFEDPIAQETWDLGQAQFYGLNRQEYVRRKTLAENQCGPMVSSECYRNIMKTGR